MADALILLFWLVCLFRGWFRGPVSELFSIAGIISGLVVAAWIYSPLAAALPGGIGSEQLRRSASFILIFSGVFLLLSVSGVVAAYLMDIRRKGWMQCTFGAVLGILKGILAIAVLLVPLVAFFPQNAAWVGRSTIFPYENLLAEKVACVTPAILQRKFSSHIDNYKQASLKGETGFKHEQ